MNLSDDDKKWFETVIDARFGSPAEFRKSATPSELRIGGHADAILAIELELENIKVRLSKLEPKQ